MTGQETVRGVDAASPPQIVFFLKAPISPAWKNPWKSFLSITCWIGKIRWGLPSLHDNPVTFDGNRCIFRFRIVYYKVIFYGNL